MLPEIMRLIALALILTIAASSAAAQVQPRAPTWSVRKHESKLGFRSQFAGQAFDGAFERWNAEIAFDPAALSRSSVTATIELASARTGDESRDQSLPTADWFNTGRYPRAVFYSDKFRQLAPGRYEAAGTLTMRGVRQAVVFPFTLNMTGKQARMSASLKINRKVFGIGQGQFASADTVPYDVTLNLVVVADRK